MPQLLLHIGRGVVVHQEHGGISVPQIVGVANRTENRFKAGGVRGNKAVGESGKAVTPRGPPPSEQEKAA